MTYCVTVMSSKNISRLLYHLQLPSYTKKGDKHLYLVLTTDSDLLTKILTFFSFQTVHHTAEGIACFHLCFTQAFINKSPNDRFFPSFWSSGFRVEGVDYWLPFASPPSSCPVTGTTTPPISTHETQLAESEYPKIEYPLLKIGVIAPHKPLSS